MHPDTVAAVLSAPPKARIRPEMNPATASHSFLLLSLRYEDISKGLISEGRFATFSVSLENEQKQLKETIPALETELEATTDKVAALQHFIEQARKVTQLTELTPEIVHEFIERIVVSKPDKVDGKRYQRVDIHYNTIGLWTAPEPEEMENLNQVTIHANTYGGFTPRKYRPSSGTTPPCGALCLIC